MTHDLNKPEGQRDALHELWDHLEAAVEISRPLARKTDIPQAHEIHANLSGALALISFILQNFVIPAIQAALALKKGKTLPDGVSQPDLPFPEDKNGNPKDGTAGEFNHESYRVYP